MPPASNLSSRRGTLRFLSLAVVLAAFALRLYHLGAESLWYDETVSAYLASLPTNRLIAHTAGDIHPPGYYLLLRAWTQVSGPTLAHGLEFLLAWPSLVCGMLVLALLLPLGSRLLDRNVGLAAAAIAAIHPFQIWYSQEVRMYTPAAALGLACLWALLNAARAAQTNHRRIEVLWLALYALFAALGLYTLYYVAFLLLALNVIFVLTLIGPQGVHRTGTLVRWLLAQSAVVILWLPWLPIFARQAMDPPVPPWRNPWTSAGQAAAAVSESLATLLLGHDLPLGTSLLWALIAAGFIGGAIRFGVRRQLATSVAMMLAYALIPIVCIWLASLWLTPLFHVRYLYTYSPIFLVLMAFVIVELARRSRVLGVAAAIGLIVLHGNGLMQFWFAPHNRADDHRAAVRDLAQRWRPGDVVLANAGWVYPALVVYWPTEPDGVWPAVPPPIAPRQRLTRFLDPLATEELHDRAGHVPLVVTGSIDGSPSLGWGSAESDFYAITQPETEDALASISQHAQRLWHYRLYDTVSDPDGYLRSWLAANATQIASTPYPGRDYLAVELYGFNTPIAAPESEDAVTFADRLFLEGHTASKRVQAGSMLYVDLYWRDNSQGDPISALKVSTRLYTGDTLLAQSDRGLTDEAQMDMQGRVVHRAAVGVPWTTTPGESSLVVVVYDAETLQPLEPNAPSPDGQRLYLATVDITPRE